MTKQQTARGQLAQFLSALFLREELIELRFIESWLSDNRKRSRVVRPSEWLRPDEFIAAHGDLTAFARRERANIYFGVCPRSKVGDADDHSIRDDPLCVVRHRPRHRRRGPQALESGGNPAPLDCRPQRLGSPRLLALAARPDVPSGAIAILWPCCRTSTAASAGTTSRTFHGCCVRPGPSTTRMPATAVRRCPAAFASAIRKYGTRWTAFAPWMPKDEREKRPEPAAPRSHPAVDASSVHAEATTLIRRLDRPCRDRSRRDFAIVCDLLRLGLSRDEIWSLVSASSKFESDGRPYFDLTVTNAERAVLSGQTARSHPRPET